MKWGHAEIDWQWVGLAAAILRTNYHGICENMKIEGMYNASLMFRSSGLSDLPPLKLDFLRLLRLTRQFEVTDSQDRIYGLLGITTEDNDPENDNFFLKPDYTTEKAELWRRVAVKVMTNAHGLVSAIKRAVPNREAGERRLFWYPFELPMVISRYSN